MVGDYVIETRLGEIRLIPHAMIGYAEVGDRIIGILVEDNKVRISNPFRQTIPMFKILNGTYDPKDYYSDIPLENIISLNEYYYGWNSKDKDTKIKLAELILGRKILATRKK